MEHGGQGLRTTKGMSEKGRELSSSVTMVSLMSYADSQNHWV